MSKQTLEKLRVRFERFALKYIAKDPSYTERAKDGGYKNSHCEKAWSDFRNAAGINARERRELKNYSITNGLIGEDTLCIIGSHDDKKRIRCSTNPKVHVGGDQARKEATRLSETYPGKKFFIFAMSGASYLKPLSRIRNLMNVGYSEDQAQTLSDTIDDLSPKVVINGQTFPIQLKKPSQEELDRFRERMTNSAVEQILKTEDPE